MTIDKITITNGINKRKFNPMRFPNPLAFTGRETVYNPLRYPSPIANHAGDTIVSKIKPLNSDVFQNSRFMTR